MVVTHTHTSRGTAHTHTYMLSPIPCAVVVYIPILLCAVGHPTYLKPLGYHLLSAVARHRHTYIPKHYHHHAAAVWGRTSSTSSLRPLLPRPYLLLLLRPTTPSSPLAHLVHHTTTHTYSLPRTHTQPRAPLALPRRGEPLRGRGEARWCSCSHRSLPPGALRG